MVAEGAPCCPRELEVLDLFPARGAEGACPRALQCKPAGWGQATGHARVGYTLFGLVIIFSLLISSFVSCLERPSDGRGVFYNYLLDYTLY